jgi:hypothetical protein
MASVRAMLDKILVANWPRAWTWLSVHVSLILIAFPTLPQEWQEAVILAVVQPFGLSSDHLPLILGIVYLVVRLVRQHRDPQDGGREGGER